MGIVKGLRLTIGGEQVSSTACTVPKLGRSDRSQNFKMCVGMCVNV